MKRPGPGWKSEKRSFAFKDKAQANNAGQNGGIRL